MSEAESRRPRLRAMKAERSRSSWAAWCGRARSGLARERAEWAKANWPAREKGKEEERAAGPPGRPNREGEGRRGLGQI